MTFGSLFSGIGGFDLGLEKAGMSCKWQCEIDKHATTILEKHWPNVPRYSDICKIGGDNLEAVDLICGGFPCQDLSMAGKRAGLAGKRSGLFFEAARLIREIKPKWYILENVVGLLSSQGGRDFEAVLNELAECGYFSAWRVLDSQYFGVAQRRKRVFIVGSLRAGCATKVLFENNPKLLETTQKGLVQSPTLVASGQVDTSGATWAGGIVISTLKARGVRTQSGVEYIQQDNEVRTLTEIECERLQGFPDNWTQGIPSTQRYKTLGNAVTVNVIKWLGKRIMEV